MYVRDSSSYVNIGASCTVSRDGGPPTQLLSWPQVKINRYVQGEKSPDYLTKIASLKDATTPLTGVSDSLYMTQCKIAASGTSFGSTYVLTGNAPPHANFAMPTDNDFVVADMDRARANALKALNRYIQEHQSPFQAQIFAGELRETLQLIRHPLQTSLNLIKASHSTAQDIARKGVKLKGKSRHALTKAIGDEWLELNFALLPLVSDIESILKVLNEEPQDVQRHRFYAEYITMSQVDQLSRPSPLDWTTTLFTEKKYQYIIRVGFLTQLLQHAKGLSEYLNANLKDLTQVVPTIWELTPYSFLVDYFVNIGDILSANLKINSFASYVCATKVQTVTQTLKFKSVGLQANTVLNYNNSKGLADFKIVAQHRRVDRSSLTSTVPPIVFQLPGVNMKMGNIAALLTKLL